MKFYIRKWFEDYQMYLKDWGCKTTNWLIFDPSIHPFVFLTNEFFFFNKWIFLLRSLEWNPDRLWNVWVNFKNYILKQESGWEILLRVQHQEIQPRKYDTKRRVKFWWFQLMIFLSESNFGFQLSWFHFLQASANFQGIHKIYEPNRK